MHYLAEWLFKKLKYILIYQIIAAFIYLNSHSMCHLVILVLKKYACLFDILKQIFSKNAIPTVYSSDVLLQYTYL